MPTALPKILVRPDGVVAAGPFTFEPSSRDWRRRRCYWRVRLSGKPVTGWFLTPSLALAAALRRAP